MSRRERGAESWNQVKFACLFVLAMALWMPVSKAAYAAQADIARAAQLFSELHDDDARNLLTDLSDRGLVEADVLLGYLLSDPLYPKRSYSAAILHLNRAAKAGDPEAMLQLAESRFWGSRLFWEDAREGSSSTPSIEEAHSLLNAASQKGHAGARYAHALRCVFYNYPCSDRETIDSYEVGQHLAGSNLSVMSGSFKILNKWNLSLYGDAINEFELGISEMDPFVASVFTDQIWRNVTRMEDCPSLHDASVVLRLMALKNGAAVKYEGRLDVSDCLDEKQLLVLERKLESFADGVVTLFGTKASTHISFCYDIADYDELKRCVVYSSSDHFFTCWRISLGDYMERFRIDYKNSLRYRQCRSWALEMTK